ncbi:MAG: hypothetical protein FWC96_01105 [Oscillospiraceae bacterium]|nr:hypothetical protein [Oscillospiraceae bacterium]
MKKIILLVVLAALLAGCAPAGEAWRPDFEFTEFDRDDESTWEFSLVAAIEEEGIYLFGGKEPGMVLYRNGQRTYFDEWWWWSPRLVMPKMVYRDFGGDGENELAIVLMVDAGRGVSVRDLHVLAGDTVYSLHGAYAHEWITAPMHAEAYEDNMSFRFDFMGENYEFENYNYAYSGALTGIRVGNIVRFDFEYTGIVVTMSVGATYENFPSPESFGQIEATVVFDGESLTLSDYIFHVGVN